MRTSEGVYSVAIDKGAAVRRHVLPFHYEASLNEPVALVDDRVAAVSTGNTILVYGFSKGTTLRFAAHCGTLYRVAADDHFVAMLCGTIDARGRTGTLYVGRL